MSFSGTVSGGALCLLMFVGDTHFCHLAKYCPISPLHNFYFFPVVTAKQFVERDLETM